MANAFWRYEWMSITIIYNKDKLWHSNTGCVFDFWDMTERGTMMIVSSLCALISVDSANEILTIHV